MRAPSAAVADIAQAVQSRRPGSTRLPVLVLADARRDVERALQSCDGMTLRHVHTRERLVDLAAFFLHRRVTRLPEPSSTACSRTCTSRMRC